MKFSLRSPLAFSSLKADRLHCRLLIYYSRQKCRRDRLLNGIGMMCAKGAVWAWHVSLCTETRLEPSLLLHDRLQKFRLQTLNIALEISIQRVSGGGVLPHRSSAELCRVLLQAAKTTEQIRELRHKIKRSGIHKVPFNSLNFLIGQGYPTSWSWETSRCNTLAFCKAQYAPGQNVQRMARQKYHVMGEHLADGPGSKGYNEWASVTIVASHWRDFTGFHWMAVSIF